MPDAEKTAWTTDPGEPRLGAETVASFMRQYIRGGGKLLVSSDWVDNSPIVPGFAQHLVMQGMTVMGVPAMATIQGSTLWPAETLASRRTYPVLSPLRRRSRDSKPARGLEPRTC